MTRKISTAIAGPVSLSLASDNPLIITNLGTITSTGANSDGVDGTAARAWAITNRGMVSSDAGWGINLAGAGSLDNSGAIYGFLGGFLTGGRGTVTNGGTINGAGGDGVFLNGNGTVTNHEGASISGDGGGVIQSGDAGEDQDVFDGDGRHDPYNILAPATIPARAASVVHTHR